MNCKQFLERFIVQRPCVISSGLMEVQKHFQECPSCQTKVIEFNDEMARLKRVSFLRKCCKRRRSYLMAECFEPENNILNAWFMRHINACPDCLRWLIEQGHASSKGTEMLRKLQKSQGASS